MVAPMSLDTRHTPLVTIGLPVFNGEAYVTKAIESVLSQTMPDLELVICDNCSTDRTQAICEAFAAADQRVRYVRHARNLGAGPNYDHCFELARGTYFKWAAHDDMLAPEYLELAVAALERQPEAVLCTVGIREIGPAEETYRVFANNFPMSGSRSVATRFGGLIHTRHQCEDFFGLYRRQALVGSGLHGTYSGSDRVLLAELALRGPWVSAPEPLFLHREHNMRYTRAILLVDAKEAALWQDTTGAPKQHRTAMFHWGIYRRYWGLVRKNVPSRLDRVACYGQLALWWTTDGHFADVVRDTMRSFSPKLFDHLKAAKRVVWKGRTGIRPGSLPIIVAPPVPSAGEWRSASTSAAPRDRQPARSGFLPQEARSAAATIELCQPREQRLP